MTVNRVVALIMFPSLERPLFLLQYVPEVVDPVSDPNPASFPSCINTNMIRTTHDIKNNIVNAVFIASSS